jgi:hypothetical protein|tara:strand:+ start:788 stop:1561 length:774 start_codon:yes stop_codon:yes gene_type:complete
MTQLLTKPLNAAAKAALKLLKKPSIMVDDTAKFAGKFGEKEAVKHLGKTRVDKAKKAIEKRGEKKKDKKKKKTPKSKKGFTKEDLKHMTKKERAEFSKLRKQQKADERGTASGGSTAGGDRIQTLVKPSRVTQTTPGQPSRKLKRQQRIVVEHPRGELKSRAKTFTDDEIKNLEPHELREQQLAPMPPGTPSQIHDMMTGKKLHQSQLDEIYDQIKEGAINLDRKHGGKVKKYKHGGKISSPRGVGKALRGWGKVSS